MTNPQKPSLFNVGYEQPTSTTHAQPIPPTRPAPPERPPYGGAVPAVVGSDTSEAAATSMESHAGRIRADALRMFSKVGERGATCDELEQMFDTSHQTMSARVRELALAGEIVETASRRKTRSGRQARVYVLPRYADHGHAPVPRKTDPRAREALRAFVEAYDTSHGLDRDRVFLRLRPAYEQAMSVLKAGAR